MRFDLSAPDYTTLSRRSQHLTRRLRPVPTDEGIHLVLDSTGLSIVGEGEWAAAKHGGCGRRGWKKFHLGVDQSGVILVQRPTANRPLIGRLVGVNRSFHGCEGARHRFT